MASNRPMAVWFNAAGGQEGTVRAGSSPLLALYVFYVGLFSLAPYAFEWEGFTSVAAQFQRRFEWLLPESRFAAWDVWTNVLFYVPYGLLFVAHHWLAGIPRKGRLWLAGLTACAVSLSFEAAQVFLPRQPSFQDVVCNSAGAVIGGLIGTRRRHDQPVPPAGVLPDRRLCRIATISTAVWFLFILCVLAVPLPLAADLPSWRTEMEVRLGLAGGLQRPWRGTIYQLSAYRGALTAEEVMTKFHAGPVPPSDAPVTGEELVLFRRFSPLGADVGADLFTAPVPVSLSIGNPVRARWLAPTGLALDGTTLTLWSSPPLRPTGWRFFPCLDFSVEVWMASADSANIGSVRIVSYSPAYSGSELALSRSRREFELRLSSQPAPPWPAPFSGFNRDADRQTPQQVLITHRDGVETRYVNGVEAHRKMVRINQAFVDVLLTLIGEQYRWPVYSVLIFVLTVGTSLCQACRSRPAPSKWRAFATVSALVLVLILLRLLTLKAIEPLLMSVSAATVLLALLAAPSFARYLGCRQSSDPGFVLSKSSS